MERSQRVEPTTSKRKYDQRPGENVSLSCASGDCRKAECAGTECGGEVSGVRAYTVELVLDEGTGEMYQQICWDFDER